MSDIPDVDFGEEDEYPKSLGFANLNLDGTIFAQIFVREGYPYPIAGSELDLSEVYDLLDFDPRDALDQFIDRLLQPYDGFPLDKNCRVYYGRDQLREKLRGMKSAQALISGIYFIEDDENELLRFVVYIDNSI